MASERERPAAASRGGPPFGFMGAGIFCRIYLTKKRVILYMGEHNGPIPHGPSVLYGKRYKSKISFFSLFAAVFLQQGTAVSRGNAAPRGESGLLPARGNAGFNYHGFSRVAT
jgi:hypothetical protein